MKLRDVRGFLQALAIAGVLLGIVFFRVTSCAPGQPGVEAPLGRLFAQAPVEPQPVEPVGPQPVSAECRLEGWRTAAQANADSLPTLNWAPFGRAETGWEIYVPLVQHEIRTRCPANAEGFAAALASWQAANGREPDGVFGEAVFLAMKSVVQTRREFVRYTAGGACPETPDLITAARIEEGYGGKQVWMRPRALAAYRRMVSAARAEVPEIAADPRNLSIFSGYRSPSADAARCQAEGNCDGVVRARCSAHRTGLAADMYVGQAPGFGPDSSADPNRLFMTRTATYRWLLANAGRFGFVNYPFEPWHWEWTGEAP
ncbi:MAG: D-alanyl-D-alanine carboxypeptidase family protein [Phenylobacterium sp.]|uniref:D-alanyl-D-alanine carboxypeptidase family protein n=1 Tax=Phenylobacterium sp. TaxID=1871053 RepID=UPI001A3661C6|nr:D-alanyl-D-alanine carboxypeptidase family protein [Phenylobacterium sp.]MBL8556700.1 D-alanyl-D-alanine carboxypeptidase family protein [Phenylobacterium sp.]